MPTRPAATNTTRGGPGAAPPVFDRLSMRDVEPDRMAAIGYREGRPVADNGPPAGRELNRRVGILARDTA